MTREELVERRNKLERQVEKLEDQLLDTDAQSATLSSGGGSHSYTNRSVADLKAKIAYARKRIAKINAALGEGTDPGAIGIIDVEYGS